MSHKADSLNVNSWLSSFIYHSLIHSLLFMYSCCALGTDPEISGNMFFILKGLLTKTKGTYILRLQVVYTINTKGKTGARMEEMEVVHVNKILISWVTFRSYSIYNPVVRASKLSLRDTFLLKGIHFINWLWVVFNPIQGLQEALN